ncbi:hypothetical protein [Aureitalea marina]|nr:hypothetical protein [Aureitalea marina]
MKQLNFLSSIRSFFSQFKRTHSAIDTNEKGSFLKRFDPLEEVDLTFC